jgi:hypothetical protein
MSSSTFPVQISGSAAVGSCSHQGGHAAAGRLHRRSAAHLESGTDGTTLTKVTLSVIPMHVSIAVKVSPWIYRAIDRL